MSAGWWRLRWLFNRRVGLALLWTVPLLIAAVAVNMLGIRIAGGIEGWQRWMDAHAGVFLVWRLLLYGVTVWGWLWMRRRLRVREPDAVAGQRLLRVEIAAVVAVVALEASLLMQAA
ncbi:MULTISPECIES: hypothetical protein [Betaproteobacteria]|uniref:Uncharacterized protein n=1 Tax=Cupriavidus nantongensis TaxID=1796606 RepID=A0A142JI16_9BURK|nr:MULTISPECIES: hypothetical protein [Betaproteobacteria]AMR77728.1 hypothetical protein A2G96_08255 [Cupriavidus nantongensis]KIN91673.1 hypothetical protein PO78_3695 [Thauera sp. SWB20]